jgi:hypothetical protein
VAGCDEEALDALETTMPALPSELRARAAPAVETAINKLTKPRRNESISTVTNWGALPFRQTALKDKDVRAAQLFLKGPAVGSSGYQTAAYKNRSLFTPGSI